MGHWLEGTKKQSSSLHLLLKLDAIRSLQRCFGKHRLSALLHAKPWANNPRWAPGGHLTQRHISESLSPTPRGRERVVIYRWPITGLSYYLPTGRCWLSYFDPVSGRAEPRCYPALGATHHLLVCSLSGDLSKLQSGGWITYPLPTSSRQMKPQTN